MNALFESSSIGPLTLKNRFIRSATWEGMAESDGRVSPRLIEYLTTLARGGMGLIITGHTYVRGDGQASPYQLGLDRESLTNGLKSLARSVHAEGGKIILQLSHAGSFAAEKLTRTVPLAVSVYNGLASSARKEITEKEIRELIEAFTLAALRAKSAGFDGVELHSAHGYLLSQFLSPIYNRRTDAFGGSVENRIRIHLEILKAIRDKTGPFPVLIKMNGQDHAEGGLTLEDARTVAQLLEAAGFDAVDISGGLQRGSRLKPTHPDIRVEENEAFFSEDARFIKQGIRIPVILVGGIRSLKTSEKLINSRTADFIAMSRPFISEPDLVRRWETGDRRPSTCISDNRCFRPGLKGTGITCVNAGTEAQARES
jgi:2,4-dienoyl-CoA reductase-like NADH-dependent reductase (Old Yellow Enzyme family)